MKHKFISRNPEASRLVVIYAGWAMDWHPFAGVEAPGYDIMVVWDYRDLSFNWQPFMRYDEVCILAWSMGVFAASVTMHEILPRVTRRIAINGTLDPIHPSRGIPPIIFRGTVDGLTPNNLRKFFRRMCTTAEQFQAFTENRPRRAFTELADELRAIETSTIFHAPQVDDWELAIIGRHDRIFAASAQTEAWKGTPIKMMDIGHLPDFKTLLPALFIDKDCVARRFGGAQATYSQRAVAQAAIAKRLMDSLYGFLPEQRLLGRVIEVGVGSGALTALYAPSHAMGTIHLWDIAGDTLAPEVREMLEGHRHELSAIDAETAMRRVVTGSADYILSASTIQWFNAPKHFLAECARALAPGGWLAISTFTDANLPELRQALAGFGDEAPSLSLPDAQGWRDMLPPTLEIMKSDEASLSLTFDTPRDVLEHLRLTGVNAVPTMGDRGALARRILAGYPRRFDGKCPLTFKPLILIARKTQ